MLLSRINNKNGEFNCASCQKTLKDFRGKSQEYITNNLLEGDCGIFDDNQVANTTGYTGLNSILFKLLVVLSFLGFQVKPLQAQVETKTDSTLQKIDANCTEHYVEGEVPVNPKKSKPRKRFRKGKAVRTGKVIGCPAF